MSLEEILERILEKIEKLRGAEGDFKINGELYDIVRKFLEGLMKSDKQKVEGAISMFNDFLRKFQRKSLKEKVKLYRKLLSLTLAFSSTVSRAEIKSMISRNIIPNDERVAILLDFVDRLERSCIEQYEYVREVL